MLKLVTLVSIYFAIFIYMYLYNRIKSYGPSSGHIQKLMIIASIILFVFLFGYKDIVLFKLVAVLIYFVALFLLVRAYYNSKENEAVAEDEISWPPKSYQDNIGNNCPDYWFKDKYNNQDACINKFNIPINDNCFKQYDPDTGIGGGFTKGDHDKRILISNLTSDEQKCNWVKNCGVKEGVYGSWTGVDKSCGTLNLSDSIDESV